jgi:coenzyme F420-0:L-glutamate ligase / coenzyme F420-1:gamma-L-glutamate ligase
MTDVPVRPPAGKAQTIECSTRLELIALGGIPIVEPGDDLAQIVLTAIRNAGLMLVDGDVLCIASKMVSRIEGRFLDLSTLDVSPEAARLAKEVGKDPQLVEAILRDSESVSRKTKNALIVRHRLGFISANASIDASNAAPPLGPEGSGPWVLLMPRNPDKSAEALRAALETETGAHIGVVITDSFGRPFRVGTVGVAVGVAGLPAVYDQRGRTDLFGRPLECTVTAVADQVAAAADFVSGQADEARPVVLVRGLKFDPAQTSAQELLRDPKTDLYA